MENIKIFNNYFTGINYWASNSATNMWHDYSPETVENDLKLLSSYGITHLRIFPLWSDFQPLKAIYANGEGEVYQYTFSDEKPLPDTPAGKAGVSEKACQYFEHFCATAEKYNLKLIVGLITGHMTFRLFVPEAFAGKRLLTDHSVLKWQLRFVKYFVNRFKTEKSIIGWDLGNETNYLTGLENGPDVFYVWCSIIGDAIKACDQTRPVISGIDHSTIDGGVVNIKEMGEMCDIHTTHPYHTLLTYTDPINTMKPVLDLSFKCKLSEDIGKIPTFVQEFGSIGYMNCSYKTEADYYRACLLSCLAHGCHGTMWWLGFDQGKFDFAPYSLCSHGNDFGFFDKSLNPKPIAYENIAFKKNLAKLENEILPAHTTNGTILVQRDNGGANLDVLRASYMLCKQANLDMNFSYLLDPIPDSPLYILPCIDNNKIITKQRFDELIKRVENGAVLFISAYKGLLRQMPEITGVNIAYREMTESEYTFEFCGESLPIKTEFFLHPESSSAEILATDQNGEGVFFKNKYGKGYVYFLTLPLERYLADLKGAFFKANIPSYDIIYREVAKCANIRRIADSDNSFIRFTEHKIDQNSAYLFAINYNNKPETAKISLESSFNITTVFGNGINDGSLTLKENDGALFKVEKAVNV